MKAFLVAAEPSPPGGRRSGGPALPRWAPGPEAAEPWVLERKRDGQEARAMHFNALGSVLPLAAP